MSGFIDATAADLGEGEMREVKVDGHDLLIARVVGEYYATDAHCPHLHGNLTRGALEGLIVTCPLHHSQFDISTGECVRWTDWKGGVKSMAELVRHPRPLRAYETRVEGDRVMVGEQKTPPV